MRRTTGIRLTRNDKAEFKRLVKNSKAKIRRVLKKYGVDLSNEIDIPDIDNFSDRQDFNEWKNHMRSFTDRRNLNYQYVKNDYDVVASKSQINEINKNIELANKRAQELREKNKDKPIISAGEKTVATVGGQQEILKNPSSLLSNHKKFDFDKVTSNEELEWELNRSRKISDVYYYDRRLETLKDNFIRSVEGSFNSLADDLVKELREIRADHFYEMFQMYAELDFALFDSEGQIVTANEGILYQIESYVDDYKAGKINFELKVIS